VAEEWRRVLFLVLDNGEFRLLLLPQSNSSVVLTLMGCFLGGS
jgi:hypothetical protein